MSNNNNNIGYYIITERKISVHVKLCTNIYTCIMHKATYIIFAYFIYLVV